MPAPFRLHDPAAIGGLIYNKHNGSTHSPVAAYAVLAAIAVFVIGYFALRALRSRQR
jgi:ribose/xylose/arabinose/galactoside ABC-type transport system permease subunit